MKTILLTASVLCGFVMIFVLSAISDAAEAIWWDDVI